MRHGCFRSPGGTAAVLGTRCGEHHAGIPRLCLSTSGFPGCTTGCSGLCWKIAISCDCLKSELSKSSQHLPTASPSPLPGVCKGRFSLLLKLFQDRAIPQAGWGLSLRHRLTMQHFFRSNEAFPCFLCCSNADNSNAMQKPQALKAAHFCFSDVN